jgi:hypothetical protein
MPASRSTSVIARRDSGSLSTRMPSQSKMTRSMARGAVMSGLDVTVGCRRSA